MGERYVLDSFAVLTLLRREAGSETVHRLLARAEAGRADVLMTWVNLGEVAYVVERRRGRGRVQQVLGALEVRDVGRRLALRAAQIKVRHPLAHADALAAALAMQEDAALVTGDPEFRQLGEDLHLEWLPGSDQQATGACSE